MKKLAIIILFLTFLTTSEAQTIRKSWSELTFSEKTALVNALKSLSSSDVNNLANEHNRLARLGIHNDDKFLPWHRIFINYFEDLLRDQDANVTLPYWDWHEETSWTGSHELFGNASSGLFGYNIMGSGSPWSYTRTFFTSWSPNVNSPNMNETSVTDFSFDLEIQNHNSGHNFIGGTMSTMFSPSDPIFYLHHGMVDKVWADWFRLHPMATGSGLSTSMETFEGYGVSLVNATDYLDPRDQKIWYADDHVLLLDLYAASGSETYYYNSGEIHVDDFTIPNGVDVEFKTNGDNIKIIKDFKAHHGAELIINTQ